MSTPEPVLPRSRQPVPVPETDEEQAKSNGRPTRSVDEIERSMAERTDRIAGNIDELVNRMSPARLARASAGRARSRVTTPNGSPRPEVIGAVAGAVLVAAIIVWRARRRR
ncbi:DUF3618 domain-containing protein [Phytoactinopolyspora limicola]|uniref:DUF3618 domain-containing protein n=1 Tax=Phytoactinopolyspora limicola TaxID=2715536 RepID=UPI00140957B1|nr:DUF3618 domain-containing protein [Phytoactinopolyspora limicola]